ncbi:hypothetical protein [Kribbella sp. NPDC049227]
MTRGRRRTEPTEVRIPADLAGPIELALAKSVDLIPARTLCPAAAATR